MSLYRKAIKVAIFFRKAFSNNEPKYRPRTDAQEIQPIHHSFRMERELDKSVSYFARGFQCICGFKGFYMVTEKFVFDEKEITTRSFVCSKCENKPISMKMLPTIKEARQALIWCGLMPPDNYST